jgi:hypothetical protein
MAKKVNDVIGVITGDVPSFTDPALAGRRLGALLNAGPRRLLVLDDVWTPAQLTPFRVSGNSCACLVTTRIPGLLSKHDVTVRVDQMSAAQARRLLLSGVPPLNPRLVDGLLAVTGRWPILLRLASKILAEAAASGLHADAGATLLLRNLQLGGPAAIDDLDLSRDEVRGLEIEDPADRARTVRATIEASTSLLDPREAERFAELGIFAEEETIPFPVAALLWRATAGLDDLQSSRVCARLRELALVSPRPGGMALHDVIAEFLRRELGPELLADINGALLEATARDLPAADDLDCTTAGPKLAWWKLPDRSGSAGASPAATPRCCRRQRSPGRTS